MNTTTLKIGLMLCLQMLAGTALADRLVNGHSYNGWSGYHQHDNKAAACSNAKTDASSKRSYPEQVESYSRCECDQTENGKWECSVDARLEKE